MILVLLRYRRGPTVPARWRSPTPPPRLGSRTAWPPAADATRPHRTYGQMSLTVVGSIAFDSVRTPFGERERMLGGSAVHFSLAASFFTEARVVGPVGDDFGDEELAV